MPEVELTMEEIAAIPCFRCGKPSFAMWNICSDDNTPRTICFDCDMELNRLVLEFMKFTDVDIMMMKYIWSKVTKYREAYGEYPEGYVIGIDLAEGDD